MQIPNRTSAFFVATILFVAALAALAGPRYQERDHDQDRDRDRDRAFDRGFIHVGHERMALDFGGGNGGRPSPDAQCEEDSVAIGFHVQTGEFFNTAWLDCVHVRPDGDPGDEIHPTGRTGSPGGRPIHDAFCPKRFALRGLRGRTGASIDEAFGICSPLREIAERSERLATERTESVFRPDAGGHPAAAECPPGAVVTGFRSNSGEYMDHLWLLCSEIHRGDHDHDHN